MLLRILKLFSTRELYLFHILIIFLIFLAALEIVAVSLIPFYVKLLSNPDSITINFHDIYSNNKEKIIFFSILIIIVYFFKNLFQLFINFFSNIFLKNFLLRISSSMFHLYLKKNYLFFIKNNSSKLIRNLTSEIDQAGNLVSSCIQIFKEAIILIGLATLIIFYQTIYSFILIIFFSILTYLFYLFFKKRITQVSYKLQFLKSEQIKTVNHIINSISNIKIMNLQIFYEKIYYKLLLDYEKNKVFKNLTIGSPRLFLEFLGILLIVCTSCILIIYSNNNEDVIYQLTLLAVASIRILPAYNSISSSLISIRSNVASLNLLFSSYKSFSKNSLNFIKNKSTEINLLDNKKTFPYKNFLSIKDIFFKYPNTKNFVFKKFNLKINFGEFVGISGVSGSGKSTLINLILGLLKPNFGLITYCGNNIHNNIKSWHSKIGYIPQDIFLIDDTIKNNIAFGLNNKDIDDEKIFSLLKKLKIFNSNGNLKKLINFNIGEFGKKLSGGQKQRIAIARALYRDPEILIFDEATSALDSKTEKKIMNLIYSLRKEKTIIFISHKLNTLKYCDKIIKVNKVN